MQIDLWIVTENIELQKEYWFQMEPWANQIIYYSINNLNWKNELRQDKLQDGVLVLCLSEENRPWEWVSRIKEITDVPMIVISQSENYYEEIMCLQNGADDYQSQKKPFPVIRERIFRGLAKQRWTKDFLLLQEGLVEELSGSQFFYKGTSLELTKMEAQVLHWLVHSPEQIVSRQKLLFHIWQEEENSGSRALDTIMKQLRKKLSVTDITIKTYYGKGFQIIKREQKSKEQ